MNTSGFRRSGAKQPVVKVGISGIDTPALLLYTGWHVDGHYA